jgi:hypothetical protein
VRTSAQGSGPEARDGARLRLGTCPGSRGVVVAQDTYPAEFDKPKPIAQRTYTCLRGVGIGEDEQ